MLSRRMRYVSRAKGRQFAFAINEGVDLRESVYDHFVEVGESASAEPQVGYWVSPTGTASWANAYSEEPLSGAACCSLSTANTNASAGDTAILRGGTYGVYINPSNSGTSGNRITYEAYGSETPTLTVNEGGGRWAIRLIGRSYIVIDGITSYQSAAFFFIGYGSCYNEIKNCYFEGPSAAVYSTGLITWYNTGYSPGPGSNHNWLHHNVFTKYGEISACDDIGTIRISANGDDPTSYNTFEDNVFSYGGHDCVDVGGWYNVVRNNVFHNEEAYYQDTAGTCTNSPSSGYFGNRCLLLSNEGDKLGSAFHTLVEGNRIGHAGTPPDDDGADGVENAGAHTIVRFNDIFGCYGMGYYSKMQPGGVYPSKLDSGSYARVYNNSLTKNGSATEGGAKYEADLDYTTAVTIWSYSSYDDWPRNIAIKNNIVYKNRAELEYGTSNIIPQVTYSKNFGPTANPSTDPLFVSEDVSDKTSAVLPDLSLQAGSPCIGNGDHLTLTNGSGSNSTTLVVDDPLYFQDGSWGSSLSDIQADWIAIGTVGNVVQIQGIAYTLGSKTLTATITLASPMTWSDDDPVWLYKDSSGRRVLYGTAPEQGAHPYAR